MNYNSIVLIVDLYNKLVQMLINVSDVQKSLSLLTWC